MSIEKDNVVSEDDLDLREQTTIPLGYGPGLTKAMRPLFERAVAESRGESYERHAQEETE